MKLPLKVSQWLKSIPPFKFLFLLAVFLLVQAAFNQQYLYSKQTSDDSYQTSNLVDLIVTNSNQQLLPLIKNNQLETIAEVLEQQLQYKLLYRIAIYRDDGTLIDKALRETESDKPLLSKVTKLTHDQQSLGYLIFEFYQDNERLTQSNFWLYYIALTLWSLAAFFLFLSKRSSKKAAQESNPPKPPLSYKKELQQLLKRSQTQDNKATKNFLIIHTDWESYNLKPRQPLLSLLNRWTAHNQSYLVSFDKDLLILGLPEKLELEQFQKIEILEICLKELGINSTILVHNLSFGEAVYQHFFGVVEPGVWIESSQRTYSENEEAMVIKQNIEIEVESYGQFHLYQIEVLKAEDATYIERQSRFFLQ